MMLTMAMPPMKRSDLIMALVPLRLPSPMVPKNTDGSLCGFLKISGSDPETREPIFDTILSQRPPPGRAAPPGRGAGGFCDLLRFALCRWWRFRCPQDQLTDETRR
jgi:hypothetical protein